MLPKQLRLLKQSLAVWYREERQLLSKTIRLVAFLGAQAAILYITATLQILGANFFLSVWLVLEFLIGIGMIFWFHKGE